jgi:hypothetical protein
MDWLYLFLQQFNFLQLMEKTILENIQAGFKGNNKIPDALVKLIEWSQKKSRKSRFY